MRYVLAVAGSDEASEAHIDPYLAARFSQRRWLIYYTREAGVPLAGLFGDTKRLDLAFNRAMPADSHPPDTRQLQPSPIDLEAVAKLLKAERAPAVAALEARVAWLLPRLDTANR